MIPLENFLLLAAIVKQRICVVSKVIKFLGLERAVGHFRFFWRPRIFSRD